IFRAFSFERMISHEKNLTPKLCYSAQSPLQRIGISCAVPNGNHLDFRMRLVDGKVDGIRPPLNSRLAAFATGFGKSEWIGNNPYHHHINLKNKPNSQ